VVRAQRTINPLHFEDLESYRFEDLVRQLAYDYRDWLYLEATGKQGRDGGVDITGIERTTGRNRGGSSDQDSGDDENELENSPAGRKWLISCKRYKEIGPTKMRRIVAETLKDPDSPPYAFVLAAACDVSAETMAAFREESIARCVSEAHLWTKAHLEDRLFQPGNDHLLFAYFGISLGARRQSRLGRVRSQLAMKRKLIRVLGIDSIDAQLGGKYALIRDIDDDAYPERDAVPGFDDSECPPWHPVELVSIEPDGLIVERCCYDGWLREDGTWDLALATRELPVLFDPRYWLDHDWDGTRTETRLGILEEVPEGERRVIRVRSLIPFESILEVDPIGDSENRGIHIYCRFDGDLGPYTLLQGGSTDFFVARRYDIDESIPLDESLHRPIYRSSSAPNQ
jgi:hypothetical protein